MSLFKRLFGKKEKVQEAAPVVVSAELLKVHELDVLMKDLLSGNHYVARSEYTDALSGYNDLLPWFKVLKDSGTFEVFCSNNGTTAEEVSGVLKRLSSFSTLIDYQNEQFIKAKLVSEKEYLDGVLKESDPNILLDDDQRRVVLTDEDYCLVVAGAGAGKTTTVAAKVKYLVDKQGIDPKQILVISFTNNVYTARFERSARSF